MHNAADTTKSIHLSASAGSGKTRALKERYLALLDALDRRGLTIDQAVAITFTDKAAAEIKERVMDDLPEEMLRKIVRGRQDLRISTIHSFCMNLLKRYPLEAGLPPDFGLIDSRDQAHTIRQAIEEALEEADGDHLMAPLRGFTIDELISTIGFLLSIRSRLKRMEIDAGGPEGLIASVTSGMALDAAEAEIEALISSPEWRASFERMEILLRNEGDYYANCMGREHRALARARDGEAAFRPATALLPVYLTAECSPRKRPFITARACRAKSDRPEYERLFFGVQSLLDRFNRAFHQVRAGRESISMLRLYLRAEDLYRKAKLREGLLDFDDLEIYAYRLLRNADSADILYWLDRKILHFLVDEFQDTSDIQWAVLDTLTAEIFSGIGADKRMPPTLFVVGDEKQSIYRFREANYRLMADIRMKMETRLDPESRQVLSLDKNYRSTPEVVGTVNSVFAGLWGQDYAASEAVRKDHEGAVQLVEIQPDASEAGPAGPSEAAVLAREIQALIDAGTMVYEKSPEWRARPAEYGDCAILIQSRTKLKEYEEALEEANIPYRVLGGIGFYEEAEIQAVMNVLFYLWNNDDTLALAACLKSPLFGLNDKDLFDLVRDGVMADNLKERHPGVFAFLHDWQMKAGLVPLARLVHDIVNDTGAYILFGRRSSQAIFNIDKLLDTARDFDRRGYTTLQDFVEWVKNIRRSDQREATADMNLPGFKGSVSILTVHKAKGLEFSVVFLPGMNQTSRSLTQGPEALVAETKGVKRLAIKDADNPLYEELWKGDTGEQEEIRREHQRLLYVAMTRARDRLIMIGSLANGRAPVKQNTWLEYLHRTVIPSAGPADGTVPAIARYAYPDWTIRSETVSRRGVPSSGGVKSAHAKIDVQTVITNLTPLPRSEAPEWKRATDFLVEGTETAVEHPAFADKDRVLSPRVRGSVLHRCLEELTRHGRYDLEQVLHEFPEMQEAGQEHRESFRRQCSLVLDALAANKDLAWIFERRDGAYSELPFLYKKGRSIVSGVIDRVIVKNEWGAVIDYKSIVVENDEALASWTARYRPQVRIYCEAVKELFRLERVEGYLLFLDSNRLEKIRQPPFTPNG